MTRPRWRRFSTPGTSRTRSGSHGAPDGSRGSPNSGRAGRGRLRDHRWWRRMTRCASIAMYICVSASSFHASPGRAGADASTVSRLLCEHSTENHARGRAERLYAGLKRISGAGEDRRLRLKAEAEALTLATRIERCLEDLESASSTSPIWRRSEARRQASRLQTRAQPSPRRTREGRR